MDELKELMHALLVDHLRYKEAVSQAQRKESVMLDSAKKLLASIPQDEITRFAETTGSDLAIIPMESHSLLISLGRDDTLETVQVIPNLSWFLFRLDA
jgi:hypothetical protein